LDRVRRVERHSDRGSCRRKLARRRSGLRGGSTPAQTQKRVPFIVLRGRNGHGPGRVGKGRAAGARLKRKNGVPRAADGRSRLVTSWARVKCRRESVKLGGLELKLEGSFEGRLDGRPGGCRFAPDRRLETKRIEGALLDPAPGRIASDLRGCKTTVDGRCRGTFWAQKGGASRDPPREADGAASEFRRGECSRAEYFGPHGAYLAPQSPRSTSTMADGGGFGRVFEIGRCSRANSSFTSRHDTEFHERRWWRISWIGNSHEM